MNKFEDAFRYMADPKGKTLLEIAQFLEDTYNYSKCFAMQVTNRYSGLGFIKKNKMGLYCLNLKELRACMDSIKHIKG